jgi:hypothetical protein
MVAGAKAVIGFNSTVLLEALTYMKPVCAIGRGVFSGNAVVLECNGEPHLLAETLEFRPDLIRIAAFLDVLLRRQIPYGLSPIQVREYPILMDLVLATGAC